MDINISEVIAMYSKEILEDPTKKFLAIGILILSLFLLLFLFKFVFFRKKAESTLKNTASKKPSAKNPPQTTWAEKLQKGMSKTRNALQTGISDLFSNSNSLQEEQLENLHELLYKSDLGITTTEKLVKYVRALDKNETETKWEKILKGLSTKCEELLAANSHESKYKGEGPLVILVVGVNGVGKTTSIGKLAKHFLSQNKSVLLCAADTYRAAAIEQLKVWGERLKIKVIAHQAGADPAAVAYDGVKSAIAKKTDVLLIDTAGRLHNKKDLMNELAKINKVIGKDLAGAPHETFLVLDATIGQNSFAQVEAFQDIVQLSGLMVTKLDGTAKGGVVIGVSDKYQLPVRYIGVGEGIDDLEIFDPTDFVQAVFN